MGKRNNSLYRPEEFDEREYGPSKSKLKRDSTELQALGVEFAALGDKVVKETGLPPELESALLLIRTLTKHEARRRHLQYVGKLMRAFDTSRIREIVAAARQGHAVRTETFHHAERLRDRLVNGDDDLVQQLFEAHPDEAPRLRQLVLAARREKDAGKPPASARALFRLLHGLTGTSPDAPTGTPEAGDDLH
ncbi:MAG: ribosome biogenesis factor YjgA [Pseudomonadota bacterium]